MDAEFLPFLLFAIPPAIATLAGAKRIDIRLAVLVAVLAGVAVAVSLLGDRGRDVETVAFVEGIALGGVLTALPLLAYFAIGWWLSQRPVVLALVWLVSLAPFFVYLFFAALGVADLVSCGPDAYECPL